MHKTTRLPDDKSAQSKRKQLKTQIQEGSQPPPWAIPVKKKTQKKLKKQKYTKKIKKKLKQHFWQKPKFIKFENFAYALQNYDFLRVTTVTYNTINPYSGLDFGVRLKRCTDAQHVYEF